MNRHSPHILIAADWARVAQSAWSEALDSLQRSREIAEQSRRTMMKSEGILQWCESFGPKPESFEITAEMQNEEAADAEG
jgi:hypothetical protein